MDVRPLHFHLVLEVKLQDSLLFLDIIQLSLLPLLCADGAIQIL